MAERTLERQLQQLGQAIESFERDGFALPPQIDGADAGGDEVARLAAQFERMSGRIAEQLALLARRAQQRRELLTKVSHDLRTPTAAMQGYLELLLLRHGSLEPAEQRNYLETAARQSERLARLVADLFQLAELDADDARLQSEDFVLAEVLHDVVQQFAAEARRRQVALGATFPPAQQGLAVHADLRLVERVLGSLIDNALRHTPPRGEVTLECSHDGARARLAVRDSGEGIAPDVLQGLFERYDRSERVAGAGATPHGGLGLAIARRIVQLHGGELTVDSERGVGTVVRFDLPLASRVSTAPQAPRPAATNRLEQLEQRFRAQQSAIARSEAARERAEADLRAVEQRYLMALRGSQDGLWEWDLASGRVQLSPRWKGMLGFDSHEIGDDRAAWFERVHPNDRAALEAALQRHIADRDGAPFDHELRLLHKDGSVRHVLSRGVAIRHENGVAYRMVGLDTDISRAKRLQEVLDAVAEGTAGAHGDAFLPALVRNFARALQVDRAFIAQCLDEPPTRVRTLACWQRGHGDVANFEFALDGTPCAAVIQDGQDCFHRQNLQQLFPRERGYEAYLGLPIVGDDGRVLGHLAFFDRAPRGDEMLLGSVYRIFLARAASELQRRQRLPRP
jgi:PAS domain S-box-containing protein